MLEIKTYRGTWDEIASHKDEPPPGALLEMHVLAPEMEADAKLSLADSLADLLEEASHLQKDEPIRYDDPHKRQVVEPIRQKFQQQGFNT